jgi:hypothetical protein
MWEENYAAKVREDYESDEVSITGRCFPALAIRTLDQRSGFQSRVSKAAFALISLDILSCNGDLRRAESARSLRFRHE